MEQTIIPGGNLSPERDVSARVAVYVVADAAEMIADPVVVAEAANAANAGDRFDVRPGRPSRFWNVPRSACLVGLVVGMVMSTLIPQVVQWMGGTYSVGAETGTEGNAEAGVAVNPTVVPVANSAASSAVDASQADSESLAPGAIRPPARNAAATALEYAKTVDVPANGGYASASAARRGAVENGQSAPRTAAAGGMGGNVFQIQPAPANTDMIAVSTQLQNPETRESYQQLTLIDTKKKVITVYHIDAALGQVSLQCVRPFRYDQELQSYYHKDYTGNPLMPSEIQQMLEEKN
ncbi:MAG: hypothetical protein PHE53_11530 [Thermoguttaceae bacterium]|nr:hypothetical protein [Thermoguttaceae bacterium]